MLCLDDDWDEHMDCMSDKDEHLDEAPIDDNHIPRSKVVLTVDLFSSRSICYKVEAKLERLLKAVINSKRRKWRSEMSS
jgi:hypothetical protein